MGWLETVLSDSKFKSGIDGKCCPKVSTSIYWVASMSDALRAGIASRPGGEVRKSKLSSKGFGSSKGCGVSSDADISGSWYGEVVANESAVPYIPLASLIETGLSRIVGR